MDDDGDFFSFPGLGCDDEMGMIINVGIGQEMIRRWARR